MDHLSKKAPEEYSVEELNHLVYGLYSGGALQPEEAVEALEMCFTATHRAFLLKRKPDMAISDIDARTKRMLSQTSSREFVEPHLATKASLTDLLYTLDERFGFAADKEIADQHQHVMLTIIDKLDE